MLVTSIFSFTHNVSTLAKTKFMFSVTYILSSAKVFNLGQSKILTFGKELTHYETTKILALSKLKTFVDDKFTVAQMVQIYSEMVENIVGKEKMLITTIFSKGSFLRVIKSRDCVVKSQTFKEKELYYQGTKRLGILWRLFMKQFKHQIYYRFYLCTSTGKFNFKYNNISRKYTHFCLEDYTSPHCMSLLNGPGRPHTGWFLS